LFDPETIARLLRHFERLLYSVAGDPDARISELEMLSEEEMRLLRREIEVDELNHGFSFSEWRA
jgi:non-ribosomal peptide synthetase component F